MKKYTIVGIMVTILLMMILFTYPLNVGDELWNFQNTYKMYNGYTIYQDCNVIQTPLFFLIGTMFFRLFGGNFFIFRVWGSLINTLLLILLYQLFRKLKIRRVFSVMYTIMILEIILGSLMNGANYNMLAFAFILIGILLQIEKRPPQRNYFYYMTQGLLIGMTILTKQNIGCFYLLGIVLTEIVSKETLKTKVWNLLKMLSVTLLIIALFLVILYSNGILEGFLNYAVYGLSEFAVKNININLYFMIQLGSVAIAVVVFSYIGIKSHKLEENQKENVISLLCIGLPMLLSMYPLMNHFHIAFGMLLIMVTFLYLIHIIILEDFINTDKKMKKLKLIIGIILAIMILYGIVNLISWLTRLDTSKTWEDPYWGIYIEDDRKENIDKIIEYRLEEEKKGKEVIVFSSKAALYNIPMKRSYGAMDLPYLGNLGKDGEDGMIEQLRNQSNTKILIDKELTEGEQNSKKIREWIQENLNYQGEIEEFLIYE